MVKRKASWQNNYIKGNYDRVNLILKKDSSVEKTKVIHAAENAGQSLNAYIVQSIKERMERDIADRSQN